MKKLIVIMMVLLMTFSASAIAEGKLKVTQKNLYEFDGDDNGYFYARVENIGDAAIGVGSGTLVGFSSDDEIVITEKYISTNPYRIILEPNEYAYMDAYIWDSVLKGTDVFDYKFSVEAEKYASNYKKIPCEVVFDLPGVESYENYVYVTFTNTTGEAKYDFYISVALLDADGNILFADSTYSSAFAIHPNSTVTAKVSVPNDLITHLSVKGLNVSSADAAVYYEIE